MKYLTMILLFVGCSTGEHNYTQEEEDCIAHYTELYMPSDQIIRVCTRTIYGE